MATPTRAEVEAQWVNAAKCLDLITAAGAENATNLIGLIDTLEQSYEGDYIGESEAAVQAIRGSLAGVVTPGFAQEVQRPYLRMYCKDVIALLNVATAGDTTMLNAMIDYMRDNAHFVQSRVITYGASAAGASNVGTNQIVRLVKDKDNFDIEAVWIDQKLIRCILDHNTGRDLGNELWSIEGQSRLKDELKRSGSGLTGSLAGSVSDDSLLSNPSFQSFGGTAAVPTSITDWTSSVTVNDTNFAFDSTNMFRKGPGDGDTTYSLKVKTACSLTQKLTVSGNDLSRSLPYAMVLIYNAETFSGQGDLVVRMGGVSSGTVTVTGQTGWQVLVVPVAQNWAHWYKVFQEDDLAIDIDLTGMSGGSVLLGEALFISGTPFDNLWYWVLPSSGNATYLPPEIDDEFTFLDTAADTSLIQKWVVRAWNYYFPHSNGSSIGWSGS